MNRKLAVVVAVTLMTVFIGVQYAGEQRITTIPLSARPARFKTDFANTLAVNSALRTFVIAERRLPRDLGELLDSPYLPAPRELLRNPYTGGDIQQVPELPARADTRVALDPSYLGNLSFTLKPGGGIDLISYRDLEDGSGLMWREFSGIGSEKMVNRYAGFSPAKSEATGYEDPIVAEGERIRRLLEGRSPADRRLFSICQYIGTLMMGVTHPYYGFPLPRTWEELRQTGIVVDVRNPYTGAPIQDVSRQSPQSGDFTYAGLFNSNSPTRFFGATPICYDSQLQPIDPDEVKDIEYWLRLEAEKNFFNPKGVLIEKIVWIH